MVQFARQAFAIGQIKARKLERFARFCAWGNHWMSAQDETLHAIGVPTTHGMCPECAAKWEAEADAPKGAA